MTCHTTMQQSKRQSRRRQSRRRQVAAGGERAAGRSMMKGSLENTNTVCIYFAQGAVFLTAFTSQSVVQRAVFQRPRRSSAANHNGSTYSAADCRAPSGAAGLVLDVGREPVQALEETLAARGARGLDIPLAVAQRVQTELVGHLRHRHGVGQVLLVREHKHDRLQRNPRVIMIGSGQTETTRGPSVNPSVTRGRKTG